MLVSPWSIEAKYDILPVRIVADSIDSVPEYCYEIASPLSAHKLRYSLAKGLLS